MSTDRSSGRSVALGVGVLILLSGCGSLLPQGTTGQATGQATDDGAAVATVVDAAAPQDPADQAAQAHPVASSTAPVVLPAAAGRVLSAAQVRAALLSAHDLGDGWSQLPTEPYRATSITPARCARSIAALHARKPGPQADRQLTAGRIGPYISESVTSMPTAARDRLRIVLATMTGCPRYVQTLPGIGALTVTTTPTGAPALGDQASAFRITQSTASTRYVVDYVAVAVGHNLLVLQAGGWSAMAPDDLRDLLDKSLAKLSTG